MLIETILRTILPNRIFKQKEKDIKIMAEMEEQMNPAELTEKQKEIVRKIFL